MIIKIGLEYWKRKMRVIKSVWASDWQDNDSPQAEKTFGIQKKVKYNE